MLHGMHVAAEEGVGVEGLGDALAPLHRLAPRGDVYAPLTAGMAATRKDALLTALGRLFRELDGDPRAREAEDLAIADPEGALRMLDDVVRPLRDFASAADDPVLSFVVERFLRGSLDATIARGLAERANRIDRVLEVAVDPAKIARLAAVQTALVERLKSMDERARQDLPKARTAALAAMRTPADMQVFAAVTSAIAARDKASNLGTAGPADARRTLEVTLAAYLRALNVPAPEGLK